MCRDIFKNANPQGSYFYRNNQTFDHTFKETFNTLVCTVLCSTITMATFLAVALVTDLIIVITDSIINGTE
jgi:hypothetical protein